MACGYNPRVTPYDPPLPLPPRQKSSVSGQVLVVLLNGQKLEMGCQMDTHTVADVTKVSRRHTGAG